MSLDVLDIQHHFADHLYAKEMRIGRGMLVPKHRHNYTHLSIAFGGRLLLQTDAGDGSGVLRPGREIDARKKPVVIRIEAGVTHQIKAIDPLYWYCIHATDETDETKIDEVLITKGNK